jgi:GH43 family beta-xylosidase
MMLFLKFHILISTLVILLACKQDVALSTFEEEKTFTNPLLESGPDPWVWQKDGWYYVTHTTGRNLKLYRTRKMSELRNAESRVVWTAPAEGMNSKQIWAPEIHYLRGKWYFYYAADDGLNENHRMWVLENASPDPFTGTWVDKGELELPDDKWAIDGTVFEQGDELFFLWSGWEGDVNGRQDIYINRLSDPWTAEGPRVLISAPEYEWEKKGGTPSVNEAPQYIERDDKRFIVYSASGCWTDDYALGLLSSDMSSDPMDPGAWSKAASPIFQKDPADHAFGPGHNSFFTSPDGTEDWILYHANPEAGQGCKGKRSVRMQKFNWVNGTPHLGDPIGPDDQTPVPSGEN